MYRPQSDPHTGHERGADEYIPSWKAWVITRSGANKTFPASVRACPASNGSKDVSQQKEENVFDISAL